MHNANGIQEFRLQCGVRQFSTRTAQECDTALFNVQSFTLAILDNFMGKYTGVSIRVLLWEVYACEKNGCQPVFPTLTHVTTFVVQGLLQDDLSTGTVFPLFP